jgi:hypothetical protein
MVSVPWLRIKRRLSGGLPWEGGAWTEFSAGTSSSGLGRFLRRHPGFARGERWISGAIYVGLGLVSALAG